MGSCVTILATVVALRAERTTTLTSIRLQDVQSALAEFPEALQQWIRSVHHLFGPLGRPGSDELQEIEMLRRVRLQGLRHRLPEDFEVGPEIDNLLEQYDEWISTWIYVPEPLPEQLELPDHVARAAADIAHKIPDIAKRLRVRLGEQVS